MARPNKNIETNISEIEQVIDDPMLPPKSLFSTDEVSAYFGIARSTVYLWIDHGILEAEKYGGTIRISREAILACRFNSRLKPLE